MAAIVVVLGWTFLLCPMLVCHGDRPEDVSNSQLSMLQSKVHQHAARTGAPPQDLIQLVRNSCQEVRSNFPGRTEYYLMRETRNTNVRVHKHDRGFWKFVDALNGDKSSVSLTLCDDPSLYVTSVKNGDLKYLKDDASEAFKQTASFKVEAGITPGTVMFVSAAVPGKVLSLFNKKNKNVWLKPIGDKALASWNPIVRKFTDAPVELNRCGNLKSFGGQNLYVRAKEDGDLWMIQELNTVKAQFKYVAAISGEKGHFSIESCDIPGSFISWKESDLDVRLVKKEDTTSLKSFRVVESYKAGHVMYLPQSKPWYAITRIRDDRDLKITWIQTAHLPTEKGTAFVMQYLPTPAPTPAPTAEPTAEPTAAPTPAPTAEPTAEPTADPTPAPTEEPTPAPTEEPTPAPTEEPTPAPTEEPTPAPTEEPTPTPTEEPTAEPTAQPTAEPTASPTPAPTACATCLLSFEKLVTNNLDGSSEDQPQEIRWGNVCSIGDERIDLVLSKKGDYASKKPWKSGTKGKFGRVNLNAKSSLQAQFTFYWAGTTTMAKPKSFYFSLFDLDGWINKEGNERQQEEVTVGGYASYVLADKSTVIAKETPQGLVCTSTEDGGLKDNPTDPMNLDEVQQGRTVTFKFEGVSQFPVTMAVTGPGKYGTRNLVFGGASSLVPECA